MGVSIREGERQRLFYHLTLALILFHFFSIISIFTSIRPGLLTSIVLILLIVIYSRRISGLFLRSENAFYTVYFAIVLASLLNYVFNPDVIAFTKQYPDTLLNTFSYLIIPSLFFYFSGNAIFSGDIRENKVVELIVLLNVFCIASGILFLIILPDFYVSYLLQGFENNLSLLPRMIGYLGNSMIMGIVCSSTIPLIFGLRRSIWLRSFLVGICLVGSFLSMQRGSWAASGLVLLLLAGRYLWIRKIPGTIKVRPYRLVVSLLIITAALFYVRNINAINTGSTVLDTNFEQRDLTLMSVFTDRYSQWVKVEQILLDNPMGIGVGMLSHVTASKEFELAIPDGNYFRIIGELGPLGIAAFLGLLCAGMYRGLRRRQTTIVIALFAYTVQAVGTNVFDFYYSGYLFWLLLGITCAPNHQDETTRMI